MNQAGFLLQTRIHLEEIRERFRPFHALEAERFEQRTDAHRWTLSEQLDHLIKSSHPYLEQFQHAIPSAEKAGTVANVKFTLLGRIITRVAGPGGSAPVPAYFIPNPTQPGPELLKALEEDLAGYFEILEKCSTINLAKIRLVSPASDRLKFNGFDILDLTAKHTHRHLEQMEAIRAAF